MNFARKAAIFFVSLIFVGLLFSLPALVAINHTIGNQTAIKQWIRDSKFYDRAVTAAIEQGTKAIADQTDTGQGQATNSLNRPEVKMAAEQAFSPQFLQSSTEGVIDGIFGWLEGKTDKPMFQINLGEAKQQFANNLNKAAKDRYASLPACTNRSQIPDTTNFDPFAVTCRVPGFDANVEIDKLTNGIATNKDFLGNNTITADDIKPANEPSQQPLYQHLHALPLLYRLNQIGLFILVALTLVTGTGIILLYPDKRQGFRRVAVKFLGVGLVILVSVALVSTLFSVLNKKIEPKGSEATAQLQQSGLYIVRQAEQGINNINEWFGIGYVILGAGTLITLKFILKPKKTTEAEDSPSQKPMVV